MAADAIDGGDVVEEQGVNRIAVRGAQVIALEKDVDGELPRQVLVHRHRRVGDAAGDAETVEIVRERAEPRGGIERLARRWAHEDEARRDRRRDAHQAAGRSIDGVEAVLVRDGEQRTVAAIRPGVVRAHERLLVAAR